MKKSMAIKKSVSFLLSAAMIISGFFSDSLWMTVQAETESNNTGIEPLNAYESGFSSDSPLKNLPVLNNVQVRNTEEEEQTELYRCSIPVGHPIELKDILTACGFLEEEDAEDYLSSLKDVSFREEGALRVYSDENDVWYVQAKDNFDEEESILLIDDNDIESEIVITDRTVQPVVTLIAEDEEGSIHTGSVSFKTAEGFSEDAEVSAEINDNLDAVNAVKESTVIYGDYYTFDLGCSEEKAGYEISMVFPLAVEGREYRLFHVGEEGAAEYTENVTVTTVEGEEGDKAAAVTFLTDRLGTFVFACTKEFEYQIEDRPYEFTITESDPVNLRDVLITTGITSEEDAKVFMTYIQSVASSDPEVLDVVLEEEVCTIVPGKHFETDAVTVTMLDGQSAEITVTDGREVILKEEAVSEPEDEEIDRVTIKATDGLLPEEAEASASVIEDSDEDGSSAMGIEEGENTKSKAFEISLSNVTYDEYEGFEVELHLNERAAVSGKNFRLYHFLDDGTTEEIPVNVVTRKDRNGLDIVDYLTFTTHSFSKFVLVYSIETFYKDAQGDTWKITVEYGSSSYIPENAELVVSELKEGDEGYEDYLAASAEKLGEKPENVRGAKAFDITLKDKETGEEYQPSGDVRVSIRLLNENLEEYDNVGVVHIHGEDGKNAEVVASEVHKDTVEFTADGFSVFMVIFTSESSPDSTYSASIEAGSSIQLSELLTQLGIAVTTEEIQTTVSSAADLTVTASAEGEPKDWTISVAETFTSGTLTLTTADGDIIINIVSKPVLTITAGSAVKTYDGTPLTDDSYTAEGLREGDHIVSVTITGSQTEVGSSENAASEAVVANEEDEDVTDAYAITYVSGTLEVTEHKAKVYSGEGHYDSETGKITYSVIVDASGTTHSEGQGRYANPVVITDLTKENPDFVFESGTFQYAHQAEFPEVTEKTQVNGSEVTEEETAFTGFPITIDNMYDGDRIILTYTAEVKDIEYKGDNRAEVRNTVTVSFEEPSGNPQEDSKEIITEFEYKPIVKERIRLEGSWAYWSIKVNPKAFKLNGDEALTLNDTFTDNQSIDYASIAVPDGVTYDYRGQTGTFIVPDAQLSEISYRTRITASPGDKIDYGNTAELYDSGEKKIAECTTQESDVIYPSPSDAGSTSGIYMIKLFVYENENMQVGIPGAEFILLDANKRPMTYKQGDRKGENIVFTTGADGVVDVQIDSEDPDEVSIHKNTAYYLEMIKVPEGYKRDSTLYGFMITDDPGYNSGGVYKYYNGDTVKVRLYQEEAGLNVSLRFSGNYTLREDQQNDIAVILQKQAAVDEWTELERHYYSEFTNGSITFDNGRGDKPFELDQTYRVIQENQRPWDISDTVILNSMYYLIIGSEESQSSSTPQPFTITEDHLESSFNVVINDEYEEPKLMITKMDNETGATLAGTEFTVFKAHDGSSVKTYTTNLSGVVLISGGSDFESETLYYLVETDAPTDYLLPLNPKKIYFYFCNDPYLEPEILEDLPEGETAVNLSETYDSLTIQNEKTNRNIPVMKIWQGSVWPSDVKSVTFGLYVSDNGAAPVPVTDDLNRPKTVDLTSAAPYNNKAFVNLPARKDGHPLTYSIREEKILSTDGVDITAKYVPEYGISDAGVYIARNKLAASLTVNKEWYDSDGKVDNPDVLAEQSDVSFNIYRSTTPIPEDIREGGVTYDEMVQFISTPGVKEVRSDVTFGKADDWTKSIIDLDDHADDESHYYYYVMETIPSFSNEIYEFSDEEGTALIKNQIAPDTVSVTVKKAELKDDPRPEADDTDFEFTLVLMGEKQPIRGYTVAEGHTTDKNGEVKFTLKPKHDIDLTLPADAGVTAAVTEESHPEYTGDAVGTGVEDLDPDDKMVFEFNVTSGIDNAEITYTNTLRVICKVTDKTGTEIPFESFKSALSYVRDKPDDFEAPVKVEMLTDYVMPRTDVFDVQEEEEFILSTSTGGQFPFMPGDESGRTTAIVTRGIGSTGSMITNEGTLTLENIILDGNKGNLKVTADGGLVNNEGTLNLDGDTTVLQNSSVSGRGGAVFSSGIINMTAGRISGNSADDGSAVYLNAGTMNMNGGRIDLNTTSSGGAVSVYDTTVRLRLSENPYIFDNTNTSNKWADIYLGADSDNVICVVDPGLGEDAKLGVFAMKTHREIGEQFANAEYGFTEHLNSFINDEFEYRGKLKDGTSTNIVWDGLSLTIEKKFAGVGVNPNDRFTIILESSSIKRTSYIIDGTNDYTVVAATGSRDGYIVFRNIQADHPIDISPLPVGTYTIREEASSYTPVFTGVDELEHEIEFNNGRFNLNENSSITVTNTRRLAEVQLKKKLSDQLKASTETQDFSFSIQLTNADGTPVAGFALYVDETDPTKSIITNNAGVAEFTMSPLNSDAESAPDIRLMRAPVGAEMRITETVNPDYRISAQANTRTELQRPIPDKDTEHDNIFDFDVADEGANVVFSNVRKMAEIELGKVLVHKVSETESFTMTITLTRKDGQPAAGFTIYKDEEHPENNITTGEDGKAVVTFTFGEGEYDPKNIPLTIPDGTKLVVEETPVKKPIGSTEAEIYHTTYSINEGTPVTSYKAEINSVSDTDRSIVFTNTRKTNTITVTNTVKGYSGNVVPFRYTATVTDDDEENPVDYDDYGFENGVQTFELTTGQSKTLMVPYGEELTIAEMFIVGYKTTIKHGSSAATMSLQDKFQVKENVTVAFTNTQLIGLRIVNNTSDILDNVKVTVGWGTEIYLVNKDQTDQGKINVGTEKNATLKYDPDPEKDTSIHPGETAILEILHDTSKIDAEQSYEVDTSTPANGYYYTIINEPSFHESAEPAILHVYDNKSVVLKGKLRYSVADSTVTFNEQPLVSFDANGGSWTTEMEGYHDKDGSRQTYQIPVKSEEKVAQPTPNPVYSTEDKNITFLGWTANKEYAEEGHADGQVDPDKIFDFVNTPVTEPLTLYAIWKKAASTDFTVAVKNECSDTLTVTATLTKDGTPVKDHTIYDDVKTDPDGKVTFSLPAGEKKNLTIPNNGVKLVVQSDITSVLCVSSQYTDADTTANSFTISEVKRDGTVKFVPGICKITDSAGNILYEASGNPAVYSTLSAAFKAYDGTLYTYTSADHLTEAEQAAVKMLVDEYTKEDAANAFPTKAMIFTTAGKNDEKFPYFGVRDRSTIYRSVGGAANNCFTLAAGNVTLTDIVLDGGSERGVKIAKGKNGGLIFMNNAGGTLNVESDTTMRNCEFNVYDNVNNSLGGAIYMSNGTLNISGGLFTNLHGYQGGAVYHTTNGTLSITGEDGETRFENCYAEKGDGGAIYYNNQNQPLVINGGTDRDNPGIIFTGCEAKYTNGKGDGSDGGAIYVSTSEKKPVTISGSSFTECSAKTAYETNAGNGGGAICANKVESLTVSFCKFVSCDTLSRGGAIVAYVKNGYTAAIDHSLFDICNCKGQGGAVAVYQANQESGSAPEEAKKTKLVLNLCDFSNCSSGTQNGSGGAVQCYVPNMEFTDTTFTDCWAGKEGGAVNNYFANGYTAVWANSYMKMERCTFTRCRAEDRYDPTALQHYGGAMNTKVTTATVIDSTFIDCVSTVKEGGALHLGGQARGSKATITGSTFINCMAKNGGGALLSSHETLEISDSFFYGCSSSDSNGGAVYHTRNSRGDSTQNTTTIINSVFGKNPEDQSGLGCSAAKNGGAIWTRGKTITIEGCTIRDCTAGGNGGGIYQSKEKVVNSARYAHSVSEEGAVRKLIIENCQAVGGSAVFVEDTASATFGKTPAAGENAGENAVVEICSNNVTALAQGAVSVGGGSAKLYFEGSVKIRNNTCSADEGVEHNVALNNDTNAVINTTGNGLLPAADIGIYVTDASNVYTKHGKEGQPFGTWVKNNDLLECFVNDRDNELHGYQLDSQDNNIYWGIYVCKITDAAGNTLIRPNGGKAVYQALSVAFNEFPLVTGGIPVYVKMLVEEYHIKQTDAISNFPSAENKKKDITLTTASKSDEENPYRGKEGTVCTISRTNSNNELFHLNQAGAVFRLENITLDGRKNKTAESGDYRLIKADNGSLYIQSGTTLQYGFATGNENEGGGGAIYAASANAPVTVAGKYDEEKEEPSVKFIKCEVKSTKTNIKTNNGGAIYANSLTITGGTKDQYNNQKFGTLFINCTACRGGAVYVNGTTAEISGADFENCYSFSSGGAVYHENKTDDYTTTTTTIEFSTFNDCYCSSTNFKWAAGGAVASTAQNLDVNYSGFANCHALSDGGAINHGTLETNTINTMTLDHCSFDHCYTTGTLSGDLATACCGGAVASRALTSEVKVSSFSECTSTNDGGALYASNTGTTSLLTISGSSFENCSVNGTNKSGGAVYSKTHTVNLQDSDETGTKASTSITNCTAPAKSGAVYLETAGSFLNIKDNTVIEQCYAREGGAVYLKSDVTLNLTGSPEFTENGFTKGGEALNAEKGACIYLAEGSLINLTGSPKFSRNYLTNQRATNGGITDYVHQDLYLAGYKNSVPAQSINVVGNLSGDTIWVWPEMAPHRKPGEQFGITVESAETVSDQSLGILRNALADSETDCSNGEYLAGVRLPGNADKTKVYWDKMYTVTFDKKDNKGVAVSEAVFTLFTDEACQIAYKSAVSADGTTDYDASGVLLPKGEVDFTTIPIGRYYMKETGVPESFRAEDITYLVLVGSPALSPSGSLYPDLWAEGGPLHGQETLVQQNTVDVNIFYGIFMLDEEGKADASRNIASANIGVINIRNDYQAEFMKTDAGNGPLPHAEFTIYAPDLDEEGDPILNEYGYPKMTRWSRDGETYPDPVPSADGTDEYKYPGGEIIPKGIVFFRELPLGKYYLIESYYPTRNGNNRLTYFVESDRVFQLEISLKPGGEGTTFILSEWDAENQKFDECPKDSEHDWYLVANEEAVCKLTQDNTLLYEKGKLSLDELETPYYHPAIYSTLNGGFDAAEDHDLYDWEGNVIADEDHNPDLKLQVLRDFTVSGPVTYESDRALTLTTAGRNATIDKYVFTTTRTSDTSRGEIRRSYDEENNDGSLITVMGGSSLTLQNINLHGNSREGRALHVTEESSLTVLNNSMVQYFRTTAEPGSGDTDVKGGAVLIDEGTTLIVDGGETARSAVFSNNSIINHRESGSGLGSDGGAIAIGKNCTVSLTNAQFLYNTAEAAAEKKGNGGAVSINGTRDASAIEDLPLRNVVFRNNSASYQGGALRVAENCNLMVENSIFTSNTANTAGSTTEPGEGGAIAVLSKEESPSTLIIKGGTFTSNEAAGSKGGAVKIGGYGTLILQEGVTMSLNSADYGGAITAAPYSVVTLQRGFIRDNSAVEGSAVYAEDYASVTFAGGSLTGNTARGENGGAVNVGGEHARLYFTGAPVIFRNVLESDTTRQRNVVLSYDTNAIINTTEEGVTDQALIGVYVTGALDGNPYQKHGLPAKPFGTFHENSGHLEVFRNDRALVLYGVKNEDSASDSNIYWIGAVCKLTDAEDNLLYQNVTVNVSGVTTTLRTPAIYLSIQDGLNAAQGALFRYNSDAYSAVNLKLKMLKDVALKETAEHKGTNRDVLFTTAETVLSDTMRGAEDSFLFATERKDDQSGEMMKTAEIIRDFDGTSMLAVSGGKLMMQAVTFDGNKKEDHYGRNGGIVAVGASGEFLVGTDAVLQNSRSNTNGGAVYAVSGAKVSVSGGTINHNESSGNGAGIYMAEGSTLTLLGNPDFGGTGLNGNQEIITTTGNFSDTALPQDALNGGKAYTKARQDIYLEDSGKTDSAENPLATLVLGGALTDPSDSDKPMPAGSIWVWNEGTSAEQTEKYHYQSTHQFAEFADGVRNTLETSGALESTLLAFRNARDDITSENATGEYLYAATDILDSDHPKYLYWVGLTGVRPVLLHKIDGSDHHSLEGGVFTIYRKDHTTIVKIDNVELKNLTSSANGVFYIGELPYGEYHVKEDSAPTGYHLPVNPWFVVTVDDTGVHYNN